jgi:diguanylate cyclase (GGDEF)-like protein
VGDDVDLVGFAGTENNTSILTDAVFRSAGASGPVVAAPVTPEQALLGKHDSELIQIDGQLIGEDLASSDTTLLLTSGKNIFTAILPRNLAEPDSSAWKIGSVLRVTGICSVQLDAVSKVREGAAVPKSFRVFMRSPQDVAVLQGPSWWTPLHAVLLLALALIGTLVVLGWVVELRRRLVRQAILLREGEERFRHMALHDALTGLATRLLLQDRLEAAVETANRHQKGLAFLAVDLDKFKEINDTFGHLAGDKVLRVTAARLLEAVRKSDTVARMGGDEFVVLLPDLNDPQAAERIASNIVEALAAPISFAGLELPVSVSVGVCSAPVGQLDAEALLRSADAALYHAKAGGRNRFQVFTPQMDGPQAL